MHSISFFLTFFEKVMNNIRIKRHKIDVGANLDIRGHIHLEGVSSIIIGDNVIINCGKKNNAIGGDTQTMLRAVMGGRITIGNNVGISNSTLVSKGEGIVIEDNVLIGGSCAIYDTDFHSTYFEHRMQKPDTHIKTGKVTIKEGAFIGAKCIILKGVTIGKKSVVGAGSVVAHNVPDNEIWAGNPARKIKEIEYS